MRETIKQWNDGGVLSVTYDGDGDGTAVFASDANEGIDREMSVQFEGVNASPVERIVRQDGLRQRFVTSDNLVLVGSDGGRFAVLKEGGYVPPEPEPPVAETYTRLTYIESTGEQYINTGYIVQEDDIIEMDFVSTKESSGDKALFGVAQSGNGVWATIYSNTSYLRFGSTASVSVSNARFRYTISMQKSSVKIDDLSAAPVFTAMPEIPLYVFASNNNDRAVNMYGWCRSTRFSIKKKSGDVVMELRPAKRDSDGKIGMLDIVSGNFYANAGDGADFVGGAEIRITEDYKIIDYVEFESDKTFDAGLVKSAYKIDTMFKRTYTSASKYMFGVVTSPHTASVTAYLGSSGAWRFGANYSGVTITDTRIHVAALSNGTRTLDYVSGSFSKSSSFTTSYSLLVGGYTSSAGNAIKSHIGYVYYFRMSNGSTPIVDWFPCRRKSDGVDGFWDCVTQKFIEPM